MSKISTVVAKQIEQFFFKQILKNVFKEKNCFMGDSMNGEMFKDFWIDAIADSCSSKSLGIVKTFEDKLSLRFDSNATQEEDNHARGNGNNGINKVNYSNF